jgi:hypothetical protein
VSSEAAGGGVPRGGIIMWSGALNAVPAGWVICNGANGTPDLRNRFVVGAGDSFNAGETGGRRVISEVPQHDHGPGSLVTAPGGAHGHTTDVASLTGSMVNISETWAGSGSASGILAKGANSIGTGTPQNTDNSSAGSMNINASHGHTVSAAPNHTHAVEGKTAPSGTGGGVDYTPPYFALAYIMRL